MYKWREIWIRILTLCTLIKNFDWRFEIPVHFDNWMNFSESNEYIWKNIWMEYIILTKIHILKITHLKTSVYIAIVSCNWIWLTVGSIIEVRVSFFRLFQDILHQLNISNIRKETKIPHLATIGRKTSSFRSP